jgi:hypothetical protein
MSAVNLAAAPRVMTPGPIVRVGAVPGAGGGRAWCAGRKRAAYLIGMHPDLRAGGDAARGSHRTPKGRRHMEIA